MTSPNSSMSSLTAFEPGSVPVNTTHLLIASALYPSKQLPFSLTAKHIAAIRINTPLDKQAVTSEEEIHSDAIVEQTFKMIRQAIAYGVYRNNLTPTEQRKRSDENHYLALRWYESENMDIMSFRECIRNWSFIEKLMSGGLPVQEQVQVEGWEVYEQVPDRVKCALGLDVFEEDGGEAMRNRVKEAEQLVRNDN